MTTERDFTQLSDEEVMNLGSADFERMAAAEQAAHDDQADKEGESEEDRQARESAEASADNDEGEQQEEEHEEESDEEESDEAREEREAREAEEEEGLDEQAIAELREERATSAAKALSDKPAKPAKKAAEPKADTPSTGFNPETAGKLFEPFTANGRQMQIRSPEEGVRLMQLGAGYNAKMEQLKPKLAIVRTLEKAGLLEEDKLAFLIDLHNKNPEAIGKLVKDSGVDVLDLDTDKVAGYKPKGIHTDLKEVELDEVLDSLKDSKSYTMLMADVSKKWDSQSKQEVGHNPAILHRINDHMNAGFYDKIVDEVNRQKALGTIPSGTPFLQAYAKVGDELNAAGAFGTQETQPAKKLVTPGKDQARKQREADDQRRKAAASTRKSPSGEQKKKIVDVWNMSDEDFAKLKM
jgi:hypothetical protein